MINVERHALNISTQTDAAIVYPGALVTEDAVVARILASLPQTMEIMYSIVVIMSPSSNSMLLYLIYLGRY